MPAPMEDEEIVTISENWPDVVIRFWFEELSPDAWFVKDVAVDEVIRARFSMWHDEISARPVERLSSDARVALAAVIVLDQFPRNMFRGSPRAFATDALALNIAQRAVAASLDQQLPVVQRTFLYMPFQHSEDSDVQARSIELFTALGDAPTLGYAHKHKDVIDRFGRYPHRNAVLGRTSTAEEIAFLKEHPGF